MNVDLYLKMIESLRARGSRITPQRKAICRLLVESKEHPSAQMIYDQLRPNFSSLSLATVYNTLETLRHLGLVNVLGEVTGSAPVRYDADTRPHINLACVRCQRIIDIYSPSVQLLDQEVEQNSGYCVLGSRVLYYGLCPECQLQQTRQALPGQPASN